VIQQPACVFDRHRSLLSLLLVPYPRDPESVQPLTAQLQSSDPENQQRKCLHNIDEIPTSTASYNVKTGHVSFHWPDNNGRAATATLPSEIQLETIFDLVLPTAERMFHPDRAFSSDDLDAIERRMERGVFRTAISEELKPYLDGCGAARMLVSLVHASFNPFS
jgi:hypothetical protein